MVHLVCGHTRGSQVAVWEKGAGEEEDGGDTDVTPPCLSVHPRRTVADGGELGLCFPLILGDPWGSGKHGGGWGRDVLDGQSPHLSIPTLRPESGLSWAGVGWAPFLGVGGEG